jgi:hypothetical protein
MAGEEYVSYSDYLLLQKERDEALMDRANGDIATMTTNHYERILRERDEWAAMCGRYKQERDEVKEKYRWAVIHWQIGSAKMERERDEALNAIYNYKCEVEAWEILNKVKRERDEARKRLDEEMKWHHQTHKELVEAQCKLLDMEYDKLKS